MMAKTKCLAALFLSLLLFSCGGSDGTGNKDVSATPDVIYTGDYEAVDSRQPSDLSPEEDQGPPPPVDCDVDEECDDGNPCTDGSCIQGTCQYDPATGNPCDDGDTCTVDDLCDAGSCVGAPLDCADAWECTIDSCKEGECVHKADTSPECKLAVEVTSPAPGTTFHQTGAIEVAGKVTSKAGPLQSFTLNDDSVMVKADGTFTHALFAEPGINIMVFKARDSFDRTANASRAFLYAEELYQVGSDKAVAFMPEASRVFLRHDVWDDDSTGDLDDVATAIFHVVNNLDVNAFIPQGMQYSGMGCTWTIDVSQVSYSLQSIDIDPQTGSLLLKGNFINFKAWIDAVASWCPDGHGWVTADNIAFEATLDIHVANGSLIVEMSYVDVEITGVEVDLQEGLASYFDWIVNWFDETFANMVEEKLETVLPEEVVPMLVSLLDTFLEQNISFDIPAIPGTTSSLPLVLRTEPEDAAVTPAGVAFTVSIGVGSKKLINHNAPGTLKRGDCKGSETGAFYLPKVDKVEAAVSEDLINQALFALWWGGHFTVSLTSDILDPLLEGFDVSGLVLQIDPYLPPIYTSCTASGQPELQLGDMHVWASFSLGGQNGELAGFMSARVEADVTISPDAGGNLLGVEVGEVQQLALDVVEAGGMVAGSEAMLESLLTELVVNILLKQYLADVLAAFPIPSVNLNSLGTYFPPNSVVSFEPLKVAHELGFLLLTGQPD